MYEQHFGVRELPFRNTPDEDFFFGAAERQDILIALEYSILRGDAIIKVVGEVGSGKTTLLRALSSRLQKQGFHIVFVPNPRFTKDEILFYIAADLGLDFHPEESKLALYQRLSDYLLKLLQRGERVVILIDEAHQIPLETLEEIRLLTNIETGKQKLVHIVLFGQPELDALLERPEARQLRSRIAHSFTVKPLTPAQVHEYLNFRMRKAGSPKTEFFSKRISKRIYALSNGLPRQVNAIADKLLLAAFARGDKQVNASHLKVVAETNQKNVGTNVLWLALILLVAVGVGYQSFVLTGKSEDYSDSVPTQVVQARNELELNGPVQGHEGVIGGGGEVEPSQSVLLDGSKYLIGVVTVFCNNTKLFNRLITTVRQMGKAPIMVRFIDEKGVWCKLYAGSYPTFSSAKAAISLLPDDLRRNDPYAIEAYKVNKLIKKRRAEVFYGLE